MVIIVPLPVVLVRAVKVFVAIVGVVMSELAVAVNPWLLVFLGFVALGPGETAISKEEEEQRSK